MGMPQSWKTLDEGMATPELRKATAPATLSSHSFCEAAVPCLGSATSSSATSWNLTFLPAISMPLALRSSMAMRTPFSLSLPKLAWGPDTGPMWPMRITCSWAMATPPMPATTAAIHNFRDIFIAHSSVETGRHVIPVIAAWQWRVTPRDGTATLGPNSVFTRIHPQPKLCWEAGRLRPRAPGPVPVPAPAGPAPPGRHAPLPRPSSRSGHGRTPHDRHVRGNRAA
ncbi:MAG: hypothetical protein GAK34_03714 [Delftia tsuruhatensis]|nr:MAG: hypothetical protein GAK34_03714 [Delftia tsuruhatensis]